MRRMPTSTAKKHRPPLSPYANLFIPIAFILGIGAGYLLWGRIPSSTAGNTGGIQRADVTTDGDPSTGPEDAPITIIEFSDYQCPYCQKWYNEVYQPLMAAYPGQIRFVYRDMPLPFHPEAEPAAEAAECAGDQGFYWQYHDALFSGRYSLGRADYEKIANDLGLDIIAFTACLDDHRHQAEIEADASDASRLGLTGTPSFFINGRVVIGALPLSSFTSIIDEELALKK